MPDIDWEVVFVDDDSDDGTFKEIEDLARRDVRVRGLLRVHERGLSSAAIAGLLSAKADYLVVMDGDGQHDPTIIPKLLAPLRRAEADITSAARDFSAIESTSCRIDASYFHLGKPGRQPCRRPKAC